MLNKEEFDQKVRMYHKKENEVADLEAKLSVIKSEMDQIHGELVMDMKLSDSWELSVEGVGRVKLRISTFANIPEANKEEVYKKLRDMNEGSLIQTKESINPQTLRGWVNERRKQNMSIPEGINVFNKEMVIIL